MIRPRPRGSRGTSVLVGALSLAISSGVAADVVTVGPDGEHASIQEAYTSTLGLPGDHEVRVQAGLYHEVLSLREGAFGAVTLSGGWNASFDVRDEDPSLTVIDAQARDVVVQLLLAQTVVVRVQGFTFRGGGGAAGGGITIQTFHEAEAVVTDCHVLDNVLQREQADGGGVAAAAFEDSTITLARLLIAGNRAVGTQFGRAGGLVVGAHDRARLSFRDSTVRDNSATPVGAGAGILAFPSGTGVVEVERVRFLDNTGTDPFASSSVAIATVQEGRVRFANNLVAGGAGNRHGLGATAEPAGPIEIVQTTVAHAGGVFAGIVGATSGPSPLTIANSLVFPQPDDVSLHPAANLVGSLIGVDPGFADALGGDYRLLPGSPALDAGATDPSFEPGALDVLGNPRVAGPAVDVGAFESGPSTCALGDTTLCLLGGRFQIDVSWQRSDGEVGAGRTVPLTDESGYLWFFSESNVEMLIKALDACVINDRFWVFAGGLTDVGVTTRVTDTATGEIRVYRNPVGSAFSPILDTDAFASCEVGAQRQPSRSRERFEWARPHSPHTAAVAVAGGVSTGSGVGACTADELTVCLGNGRFAVTAQWRANVETAGEGRGGILTADTGTFWFFNSSNLEIVLKVLDACAINQHFWVFAAGLTNVEVLLSVVDTVTGRNVRYASALGDTFAPITDVEALSCSP